MISCEFKNNKIGIMKTNIVGKPKGIGKAKGIGIGIGIGKAKGITLIAKDIGNTIAGRESNKAMYTKSKKGQLSGPLGGGSSKSSLTLRKDAKDIIFDVLRKMDQLNVSRGSGTESDDKSSSIPNTFDDFPLPIRVA